MFVWVVISQYIVPSFRQENKAMPEDVDIFIDEKDIYSDRRNQIPYEKRIKAV